MVRTRISAIVFALTSVFAAQAMAATDAPVTREQVKAELAEAMRTGNVVVGESSATLREAYPQNYPAEQHVATKSRGEVRAELAEAFANGWMDRSIEA